MVSLQVQQKPRYRPHLNHLIENLIMANEDKNLHEPAEEVSGTQILHGKAPFFSYSDLSGSHHLGCFGLDPSLWNLIYEHESQPHLHCSRHDGPLDPLDLGRLQ